MTVTGIVPTRNISKRAKSRFSKSREPRRKKGKKNDEFVLDQAQQLVSELAFRSVSRPLFGSEKAPKRPMIEIADRRVRKANRFKRKSRQMARLVVQYVIDLGFVEVSEFPTGSGMYTYRVTDAGERFMRNRSRSNHPSERVVDEASESAA